MNYISEHLYFREFNDDDFPLLYSIFSNEQVMRYTYLDKYHNEEELMPYFNDILKNNQTKNNRKAYEYAVCLSSDDACIGIADIVIDQQNDFGGIGEIGYLMLPEYWGKGFGTAMAKALLEIGFRDVKLHKLYARCNVYNVASRNVMEKIGMKREGELRKVRFKDNMWVNEFVYGILAEERD